MEQQTSTLSAQELIFENQRIMMQIVQEMREDPPPPSEQPKDVSALQKVEIPPGGGILTYMEGHEYPYRGFPFFEFVDKVDLMKKVIRAILSGLYHGFKGRNKLLFFTLIPSFWLIKVLVRTVIYAFYRIVFRFRIKQKMYSQSIRELYRAFSADRDKERLKSKELRMMLREVLCMTLEFDNAYRYRFQDIIVEINKQEFTKNPAKELVRLLEILQSREKTQDVIDTWTLLKLFFKFYLKFDKELKNILIDAVKEIKIEELELKDEDKHYCIPRKDYNFGFMLK